MKVAYTEIVVLIISNSGYYYYSKWKEDGKIEEIHEVLRAQCRQKQGRKVSPSTGLIDSQSVKTTRVT
jgi:transposase